MTIKRLLITGSTGLLGRYFIDALQSDPDRFAWEIVRWDRRAHGDLTSSSSLDQVKKLRPDVVLHFAWLNTTAPKYDLDEKNQEWARSTTQLANTCAELGIWFIGLGTCLELQESTVDTNYVSAKKSVFNALNEPLIQEKCTWIRPHWIVDIGQKRPRVVAAALDARNRGIPFTPDNPTARLDFIDARDVAAACLAILNSDVRGVVEVGSGQVRPLESLLQRVRGLELSQGSLATEDSNFQEVVNPANTDKLFALGWRPEFTTRLFADSLQEGM